MLNHVKVLLDTFISGCDLF